MGPVTTSTTRTDAATALEAARSTGLPVFLSTATSAQHGDGPLAGLPFAVKDNIDVAGLPSTAACPALTEPATAHAVVVQRLVDAGAVPVAKTNLDQFATGLVGTRSPYGIPTAVGHPEHVSGGSSSGSAVAVASGVVPLALGTDTAGSGRVPAAFNGLVGVKATRGLISTRGVLPACRSLDCVTTLTRTVAQARAVLDVIVAPDPADPYSRTTPVTLPPGVAQVFTTVGVPAQELDLDPETRTAWARAVEHARALGLHLVEVDVARCSRRRPCSTAGRGWPNAPRPSVTSCWRTDRTSTPPSRASSGPVRRSPRSRRSGPSIGSRGCGGHRRGCGTALTPCCSR
jgi:allophanate hydrolase